MATAEEVFSVWEYNCPCGNGEAEIADCPGPPNSEQIGRVMAWLSNPVESINIWPFKDMDTWDWYVITYG